MPVDSRYTDEELSQYARQLATEHPVAGTSPKIEARQQLNKDIRTLNSICLDFCSVQQAKANLPLTGEWLVENNYLIDEQAQFVKQNFPAAFYRHLPKIKSVRFGGLPRIQAILTNFLEYTDGKCDSNLLAGFLKAYQEIQPLTMGELWAVPLLVRVAIIHRLRVIFEEISRVTMPRRQVIIWVKQIAPLIASLPNTINLVLIKIEHLLDLANPAVLVQLAREFRNSDDSGLYLRWLESRAAAQDLSLEDLVEADKGRQIQYRVTVGHLLASLHEMNHIFWEESFEELSLVENTLRRDPAAIYPEMDFASRDVFRHKLEKLSRRWKISEQVIAEQLLNLADVETQNTDSSLVSRHIGYYLMGTGVKLLTAALGKEKPWRKYREKAFSPNKIYFGSLILLIALFLVGLWNFIGSLHVFSTIGLVLITMLLLVPAAQWAVLQLHRWVMYVVKPKRLPKLEFRSGIPQEHSTMVVIPTIINSAESVTALLHQLEIYHLANLDPHIYFALLTDFQDAAEQEIPEDNNFLFATIQGITELNKRYPHPQWSYFFLMHRRKLCNPTDDIWMGWERKRGKLVEFNALLLGDSNTSYEITIGDQSVFPTIRYVITLDADTKLPRDAAVRLIGAMAHPLNAPVLNAQKTKVISGYGLLQPRISVSNSSINNSAFARLFGGRTGIDIYSGTLSDPYQDLFQYGIFTGKGIYDLRTFDQVLGSRIPDNSVLSHDLLEGGFLHAGLVTDVELFDDYPVTYLSSLKRAHRWVRGDWQLLPWLAPHAWNQACEKTPVPLAPITRWQIIDNLLRSLLGPVLYLCIVLAVAYLPDRPVTINIPLLIVLVVAVLASMANLLRSFRRWSTLKEYLLRMAFSFLVLPYHSLAMVDAIGRTLFRMGISHRNLLEWISAADEGKRTPSSLIGVWQRMLGGQLVVLGSLLASVFYRSQSLLYVLPLSVFWLSAPLWVHLVSRPKREQKILLAVEDIRYLQDITRRTWHFFDTVVGADDNWLPPDNLQIYPANGLAHRTSPTNIGLYLAAILAAGDFGYLTTTEALTRITLTVNTVDTLPRWHGHFYNWYDTQTLQPLPPEYVSTVDSGNLVAYLIVVKEGLGEFLSRPLFDPQMIQGLLDTIRWESGKQSTMVESMLTSAKADSMSLIDWYRILKQMINMEGIATHSQKLIQIRLDELDDFLPWLCILEAYPDLETTYAGVGNIRSLADVQVWIGRFSAAFDWNDSVTRDNSQPEVELARLLTATKSKVERFEIGVEVVRKKLTDLIDATDFTHLYDWQRHLYSIGYNMANKKLDNFYYDLLASEARQTSFITIALGQVPTKHWFALGRPMTLVNGRPVLISWSGTMFEYLMPLLLLPFFPYTLWDQTYRMVVRRQMSYAHKVGIPWGVSESGFNAYDFKYNYQYQAFGIPGLGLKPGLENDRVISPYSTALAVSLAPAQAVANLRRLEQKSALDEYGFFEAIDFTPVRQPEQNKYTVIKSYMAHHQGMIFLSLANMCLNNRMSGRFLSDPRMEAAESLLREPISDRAVILSQKVLRQDSSRINDEGSDLRIFKSIDALLPEARFLSNGKYLVMVSAGGGGFSQWGDLALTRWAEDPVRDSDGTFFYIRNLTEDKVWSPSYQPCRIESKDAAMSFSLGKIVFTRTDGEIHTQMNICVSAEFDAEIREIVLTNHGQTPCTLEVSSFLEPVLASLSAYNAHPVYSRLFIETEALPNQDALLAHRRAEEAGAHNPWLVHTVYVEGQTVGVPEFETDRSRFIGRGRSTRIPQALQTTQRLSGTSGHVIDPVFCLRRRVEVVPETSARFYFVTGIAASRVEALEMIQQMRGALYIQRTFELAWTRSRVELRYLSLTSKQANLFQWMASQLFYFSPYRSGRSRFALNNRKGQSGLWPYGISGDFPIVLVRLTDPEELSLVKTVLRAHEYWRMKGMKVDLVILNDFQGSYEQPLQEALRQLIETSSGRNNLDQPGGVFLRSGRLMPEVDQVLLETVARISLRGNGGNLEKQLKAKSENELLPVWRQILLPKKVTSNLTVLAQPKGLLFFNGWGGFTNSGSEYVIILKAKDLPPSPWINVIANQKFGFQVSESGGGYTWAANSREFKLTPWSNDPVLDPSGEICYLRDEENGMVWSFTPLPIRDDQPYTIRHGQGYTIFSHVSQGIEQTGTYFVPLGEPLKIIKLTLRNTGKKPRRLAITYYLEWVLGVHRSQTAPYINTEIDSDSGALLAHNVYQDHFPEQFGFMQMVAEDTESERSWTGDRLEFIGRNGSLAKPAGLARRALSNRTGSGYNPCGAMQVKIDLAAKEEQTVTIIIGSAKSGEEMRGYLNSYRQTALVESSYQEAQDFWDDLLGQVQVYTPDTGLNLLLNRWLLYQTLSSRLWARSAFYQSGGAYGFRDQLQDCLALLYAKPSLAKAQILKHAAHQFREGDVQHWWHEETGYGIRTRFSDDLLWLPYAALRYIEHTGDHTLWQEVIPFLEGEPLQELEMEHYGLTKIAAETASLYEHCLRAIDHSLRFGSHGLPLMGGGDWNDGMNRVGKKGQGESVWLGWFLYTICQGMIPVCLERGDESHAQNYRTAADQLGEALNRSGWDGNWYRRAYNDNGEPLGSSINYECQIDCIAQAWAVISGAAPKEKAMLAMNSLDEKLVSREDSLLNLLTPPFNSTTPSPGYIQAYPPGVRENGGQYTHGAIWVIIAWAMLGEGNRAYELFHMLNPINHARNHNEVQRYKVEPYVMAADVYSVPPYVGRGGWTWYTGAAGWMYQAGVEWILGLQKKGANLLLNPCIPEDWREFRIDYKFGQTTYQILVKNPAGKQKGCDLLELDGKSLPPESLVPLTDDGQVHQVLLVL